jgi:hypothetical protein
MGRSKAEKAKARKRVVAINPRPHGLPNEPRGNQGICHRRTRRIVYWSRSAAMGSTSAARRAGM